MSFKHSTTSGIYSILLEIGLCLYLFDKPIGLSSIHAALLVVLLHYCDRYKKVLTYTQKSNKTESEKDKTVEIKSKEK